MTEILKAEILACIDYAQEQYETSGGEINQAEVADVSEFDNMRKAIEAAM